MPSESTESPVCDKCGGTVRRGVCNICVMLGQAEAPKGDLPAGWPLHSTALAVDPSQVAEETAYLKKRGVNARFDAQGRPVFDNRRARREHMRALGVSDYHSFSGH